MFFLFCGADIIGGLVGDRKVGDDGIQSPTDFSDSGDCENVRKIDH